MAKAGGRAHYQVTFAVLAMGVAAFALLQSLVIPAVAADGAAVGGDGK
jgi:hypothetical protein